MTTRPATEAARGAHFPLAEAAELQDDLLAVDHDLERLAALLAHAGQTLLDAFAAVATPLAEAGHAAALDQLARAFPALQFEDLASQLLGHSRQRLGRCVDRIARRTFADEEGEPPLDDAALRPNPVTQSAIRTGSVELF